MRKKIDHDKQDGLTLALFTPNSRWTAPIKFPDLSGEKMLGLDTETHDPNLMGMGPGFIRGDAKVVGISIATADRSWYFPFGHLGGGNMDKRSVISYIGDLLNDPNKYIVGANLQYELESLDSLGIKIQGRFIDVQLAEALIDEEQETYQLESIANKYLGKGKNESLLREAASAYGIDPKSSLWKLPAKYVGPYAEWDAQIPIHIFQEQLKIIKAENLEGIFQLESELLELLWLMRKQGIPIDVGAAERLSDQLAGDERALRAKFRLDWGQDIDEWSGAQIALLCESNRILFPRTAIGNPSFTSDYMESADHPLLMDIHEIRQINRFRQTFVNDWLLKWNVRGRIHPQWRQVARDEGGTRSGRMAASCPNPQQVPASKFRKTGKPSPIGKAIRRCFISDTGMWCKKDYSQQEPRILTHFAAITNMTGAEIAKNAYVKNPGMDFYQYMMDSAGIERRPAKDMYLGRCYGMGVKKLAYKLNRTEEEAKKILADFDAKVPFVKEIADKCSRVAADRGYIKTLLGRRRHFNLWEPVDSWKMNQEKRGSAIPLRFSQAQQAYPGLCLVRSGTHKALNALIQGSAADMTKASLLKIWKETGIVPYMAVHDEIGTPVKNQAQAEVVKQCCETSVTMCVPIKVDMNVGKSWK